jgi:hypothetical protein
MKESCILYQNVNLGRLGQNVEGSVLKRAKMVSVVIQLAIVLVDARLAIKAQCVEDVSFKNCLIT